MTAVSIVVMALFHVRQNKLVKHQHVEKNNTKIENGYRTRIYELELYFK